MLKGETVIVKEREQVSTDPFGHPVYALSDIEVENVLVHPKNTQDSTASNRPEGDTVSLTLHFPKTCDLDLRNHEIVVRDERYTVSGDPQRYEEWNTPGDWNMSVDVVRIDG